MGLRGPGEVAWAAGVDGTVYGVSTTNGGGGLLAINADGTDEWAWGGFTVLGQTLPAFYAIADGSGTVYVQSNQGIFAVVPPSAHDSALGAELWETNVAQRPAAIDATGALVALDSSAYTLMALR
jgi:hypothetical protein